MRIWSTCSCPAAVLVAIGLTLAAAPGARAQLIAGQGLNTSNPGPVNKGPELPKTPLPPTALPGAETDKDRVAPATKVVGELSPNDALFDGINRGDLGTVRDAVNRGADLESESQLGETPLELSVDLGRNDITFYLLGQRGDTTRRRPPPGLGSGQAQASKGSKPGRAEHLTEVAVARDERIAQATAAKAARDRLRAGIAARDPAQESDQSTQIPGTPSKAHPTQYASDGGAPVPTAGFLGFGGSSR